LLAELISGFAPRTIGVGAWFSLRERGGLALAPPVQLVYELLELGDPTLLFLDLALLLRDLALLLLKLTLFLRDLAFLLSHSVAKLRVFLKEFLVTRHVYRELDHAYEEDSSPCDVRPARAGTMSGGREPAGR
jgi:hypothetical protein